MKAKIVLSAVIGFFFALVTYFLLQYMGIQEPLLFAIIAGVSFFVLLFLFLIVYGKMMDKKYAEIEEAITSPIFYKTNGNFMIGPGKVKNGNIYFCETGIVCVCLEEKPYALDELLLQDIDRYQFDNIHLNIFAKDGRLWAITTPDVKNIVSALKEKNWLAS